MTTKSFINGGLIVAFALWALPSYGSEGDNIEDHSVQNTKENLNISANRISKFILHLSDDSFKMREEASRKLIEMGPCVIPILRKVASKDPEIVDRLNRIINEAQFFAQDLETAVVIYKALLKEVLEDKSTFEKPNIDQDGLLERLKSSDRAFERVIELVKDPKTSLELAKVLVVTSTAYYDWHIKRYGSIFILQIGGAECLPGPIHKRAVDACEKAMQILEKILSENKNEEGNAVEIKDLLESAKQLREKLKPIGMVGGSGPFR